jgi:hypothetical protein
MFTRKAVFSARGRAAVMATVAAGPRPATPPTSAPAAGSIAAVVALRRPRLPVLSEPVLRSPRSRTAAPIMTITMVTMAAAPSTTAGARIITAVTPTITAGMAACPITGAIPSRVGNRKSPDRINPPVTVAGGFLLAGTGR